MKTLYMLRISGTAVNSKIHSITSKKRLQTFNFH